MCLPMQCEQAVRNTKAGDARDIRLSASRSPRGYSPLARMTPNRVSGIVQAPGHPGIAPTWTSSAKDMVGRRWVPRASGSRRATASSTRLFPARGPAADPRPRLIVADGKGFWVEVGRCRTTASCTPNARGSGDRRHPQAREVEPVRIVPTHSANSCCSASRSTAISIASLRMLAPHLGGSGSDNLASGCRPPPAEKSCGRTGPAASRSPRAATSAPMSWGGSAQVMSAYSDAGWQDSRERRSPRRSTAPRLQDGVDADPPVTDGATSCRARFRNESRGSAATLVEPRSRQPVEAVRDGRPASTHGRNGVARNAPVTLRRQGPGANRLPRASANRDCRRWSSRAPGQDHPRGGDDREPEHSRGQQQAMISAAITWLAGAIWWRSARGAAGVGRRLRKRPISCVSDRH